MKLFFDPLSAKGCTFETWDESDSDTAKVLMGVGVGPPPLVIPTTYPLMTATAEAAVCPDFR
jgi:hypothetical protein